MTATVGSPPGRVVVRLPNWIGDIVMATPLLRALRQAWPRAHVAVAGPKHAAAILDGLDSVDEVLDLPSRRASGLGGMRRAAARLAEGRFDLGLLLTNSFSSALVMALARVPLRVGYAEGGRGPLLTHKVSRRSEAGRHRMPVPMVEAYARLLDAVGVPRAGHRYELVATPDDEQAADAWMQRQGLPPDAPLWGFHPGASFGPSKLWYPERFAAVADALVERRGGRALVFCGPAEADLARAVAAAGRSDILTAADDPISLGTLKAVVKRLSLLVTIDTGPRHFGAAFDVPTVVLMGATEPRFTNTNLHSSAIVRTGVSCSPCQRKVCPLTGGDFHRCMTTMSPEQVLAACERVLEGAA